MMLRKNVEAPTFMKTPSTSHTRKLSSDQADGLRVAFRCAVDLAVKVGTVVSSAWCVRMQALGCGASCADESSQSL